jgi:hypothetical protein
MGDVSEPADRTHPALAAAEGAGIPAFCAAAFRS